MRLNNLPLVVQADVTARAICFVIDTGLFPKGAVGRRKRGGPAHFLIKPNQWPFQVLGLDTN